MNTKSLFARISAVFFVSCVILAFTGCGEPPVALKLENEYKYNPETYTKPEQPKQSFEYYEKYLKNIPMDYSEVNQDFSDMDTVKNEGGWIVDVFQRVDNGRREIYVLFNNNNVIKLSGSQLALDWVVKLQGRPSSPPAFTKDDIIWLTDRNQLSWYYRDKQADQNQMKYTKNLRITPSSHITANESGVYMSSGEHFRMYGFDSRRKLERWYWPTGKVGVGSITMTPHASEDRLFFYNNNGQIYCISADDGSEKWSFDVEHMNANFSVKEAGSDKLFFIPSWSSKLYCMNTAREVYWAYHAQEPIVSTPFVEDSLDNEHYVIFETPSYLTCIKYYYNSDVQSGKGMIRLVDPTDPEGRKANEPVWQMPLFPEKMHNILPGGTDSTKYSSLDLMEMKSRMKFQPLLIGKKWLYVLQTIDTKDSVIKWIRRIDLKTGVIEKEGYDVSMFTVILGSSNEDDRSIYFATPEGYLYVMTIPE